MGSAAQKEVRHRLKLRSMENELKKVREWAEEKLAQGSEPPWAWFQYMKLVETIRALEAGMAATITRTENSPQSEQRPDAHLRLVASTDRQDIAQPHPVGLPVLLPM
jgi:hypothetical protein